jgi:hypothetical protein
MSAQLALFRNSVPKRPYCTDDLVSGLVIRDSERALGKRYIQHNHPNSKLWMVYDIDRRTSPEEIEHDLNLPPPNLFVQNPKNGHAHVLYSLDVPVHCNENSSPKAIRFAGAVDCGLSIALRADAGYSGLICKNPLHEHWRTVSYNPMPYSLGELSDYVDLKVYQDRRKHLPEIGLGRNCTLFDNTRRWAYRERLKWATREQWHEAVLSYAMHHNHFDTPLPISEVKAIAKSVSKWTWRVITVSGLSQIQSERGKRSGKSRAAKSLFKRQRALELLSEGMTQKVVAERMGVSERQVRNWKNTV